MPTLFLSLTDINYILTINLQPIPDLSKQESEAKGLRLEKSRKLKAKLREEERQQERVQIRHGQGYIECYKSHEQ